MARAGGSDALRAHRWQSGQAESLEPWPCTQGPAAASDRATVLLPNPGEGSAQSGAALPRMLQGLVPTDGLKALKVWWQLPPG